MTIATSKQLSAELTDEQKLNKELHQQVEAKKKELESALTLQAARKVQSEHDKITAAKAKAQPEHDTTSLSIVRNTVTSEDMIEAAMLSILNAKRATRGLEPFKSYAAYLGIDETPAPPATPGNQISIVPTTTNDPVTPLDKIVELSLDYAGRPLAAAGDVYLIAAQGYYIGWNTSRCYIQKASNSEVNILVAGDRLYGELTTMAIIPNKTYRDLTKAEFDSIVQGKPAYNDLFKVFCKTQNFQNVHLNTRNAIPVW